HRVATLARDLAVADELIVVDAVEAQIPVGVQRGVVAASRVDAGDEIPESVGAIEDAVLDLVLFGVEILLASRLARFVLAPRQRGPVNAVVGGERGGEPEPGHERRAPAGLEGAGG